MLERLRALLSFLFHCARAVFLFLVLLSDALGFPPAARAVRQWEEWLCRLEHRETESNCSQSDFSQRAQTSALHAGVTGETGESGYSRDTVVTDFSSLQALISLTAMAHRLCGRCVSSTASAFPAAKSAATHALQSHLSTATSATSPSAYNRSSPAAAALRSCRPTANYPPPRGAKAWWYQPWLAHSAVTGARRLFPAAGGGGGPGGAGAGGKRYVGTVPPATGGRGVGVTRCEGGGAMYTWPDPTRPRVCVLGGGFGGLYAALRLDSLLWSDERRPQVLLVDQSERFVLKPLLYELLSQDALALPLPRLPGNARRADEWDEGHTV
ncbi:unnamed protein product [Closterium sp. NIES-65]|nr:unnamed protein product [Closterium sp. NIES-65]